MWPKEKKNLTLHHLFFFSMNKMTNELKNDTFITALTFSSSESLCDKVNDVNTHLTAIYGIVCYSEQTLTSLLLLAYSYVTKVLFFQIPSGNLCLKIQTVLTS